MVFLLLVITYVFPTLIAPLFNKFKKLEKGSLKEGIEKMAQKANFAVSDIYQMDASKRSTHSNAYFTGFFKKKRIVLFDTLLERHTDNEIIAILAHEIGHFKLKHILKTLLVNVMMIFIMFYFVSILIDNNFIYDAFAFEKSSYVGLFVIFILFSPINFIITPFLSAMSRKHEYEADKFAKNLTENKKDMSDALIKIHKDNLSNPFPHPLYVKFYYSHPPLIERISELEKH